MKIGKIKKDQYQTPSPIDNPRAIADSDNPAISQNITLEEVLQETIRNNPSAITNESGNVDPAKLQKLVRDISIKINNQSKYNQTLDARIYKTGSSKTNWDPEEVAALKE